MNIWKRSLSLFLALVMVLGMVPFNALDVFAATELEGSGTQEVPYIMYIPGTSVSGPEVYSFLKNKCNYDPGDAGFTVKGTHITEAASNVLIDVGGPYEVKSKYTLGFLNKLCGYIEIVQDTSKIASDVKVKSNQSARFYTGISKDATESNIFNAIYDAENSIPNNLTEKDVVVEAYIEIDLKIYKYSDWTDVTATITLGGTDYCVLDLLGENPRVRLNYEGSATHSADISAETTVKLYDDRSEISVNINSGSDSVVVPFAESGMLNSLMGQITMTPSTGIKLYADKLIDRELNDADFATLARENPDGVTILAKFQTQGDPNFKRGEKTIDVVFTGVYYDVAVSDGTVNGGKSSVRVNYDHDNKTSTPVVITLDTSDASQNYTLTAENGTLDDNGDGTYTLSDVTSDTALAVSSTTKTYTVTYQDGKNGAAFETYTEPVEHGGTPVAADPVDQRGWYNFAGWTSAVTGNVTANATYTATWTPVSDADGDGVADEEDTFVVIWYDEDGTTVLGSAEVKYGTTPTNLPANPSKAADNQYTYTFSHWEAVTNVVDGKITGAATYKAVYTATEREYTVIWVDGNGNPVKTSDVKYLYSQIPAAGTYDGETPEKNATNTLVYAFDKWSDVVYNTDNMTATYTAEFTSSTRYYTVIWKNWDGSVLETDTDLQYNATPSYDGVTPTKPNEGTTTYTWKGWTPAVSSVTGDVTYTATFTSATITYTVTFTGEGVNLPVSVVDANDKVDEPTVTREGYVFACWLLNGVEYDFETPVTGDITLTAKWQKVWTVTFTGIGTDVVMENVYDGTELDDLIAQVNTNDTTDDEKVFKGWTVVPNLETVAADITLTANWGEDSDNDGKEDGTTADPLWTVYVNGVTSSSYTTYESEYVTEPSAQDKAYAIFNGWDKVVDNENHTITYTIKWIIDENDNNKLDADETAKVELVVDGNGTAVLNNGGNDKIIITDNGDGTYTVIFDSSDAENGNKITVTATSNDPDYTGGAVTLLDEANSTLSLTLANSDDVVEVLIKFVTVTLETQNNPIEINGYDVTAVDDSLKEKVLNATGLSGDYTVVWNGYTLPLGREDQLSQNWTIQNSIGKSLTFTITDNTTGVSKEVTLKVNEARKQAVIGELNYVNGTEFDMESYFKNAVLGSASATQVDGTPITSGIDVQINRVETTGVSDRTVFTYTVKVTVDDGANWLKASRTFTNVTWTVNQYKITWVDSNDNELYSELVDYGATPSYTGATPEKNQTVSTTYTFKDWGAIETVSGDKTYTAQFTESAREYKIHWDTNGDGTVDTTTEVAYDTTPTAPDHGEKENHWFKGWDPEITEVTGEATYTALFTPDTIYHIKFMVDGKLFKEQYINVTDDASAVVADPGNPDVNNDYANKIFDGWDVDIIDKTPSGTNYEIVVTAEWNEDDENNNNELDENEFVQVEIVKPNGVTGGSIVIEGAIISGEDHIYNSDNATHTIVITPPANHYVADVEVVSLVRAANLGGTYTYENGKLTITGATLTSGTTIKVTFAEHSIPAVENPSMKVNGYIDEKVDSVTKKAVLEAILGKTLTDAEVEQYEVKMYVNLGSEIETALKVVASGLIDTEDVGYYDIWALAGTDLGSTLNALVKSTLAKAIDVPGTESVKVTWKAHDKYPAVSEKFTVALTESRTPTKVEHNGDTYTASSMNDALLEEIKADLSSPNSTISQVVWADNSNVKFTAGETVTLKVTVTVLEDANVYGATHTIAVTVNVPYTQASVVIPETENLIYNTGMTDADKVDMVLQVLDPQITPTLPDGMEPTVWYLASKARNVDMVINLSQMDLGIYSTIVKRLLGDSITIQIHVEDMWLNIGDDLTIPEMPSNERIEWILMNDLIPNHGADFVAGQLTSDQMKTILANTLKKYPDIAEYYKYLGAHQFGDYKDENGNLKETVYVSVSDYGYGAATSNTCVLNLTDTRTESEIKLNTGVQVVYNNYTEEQLLALILDGVYANGNKIDGLTVEFVTDVNGLPASDATEVTVKFAGNRDYKPATATVTIKINKAPLTLSVDNRLFKWPASLNYSLGDVIITKSNGVLVDVDTINFIAGLDVHEMNIDGGLKGLNAEVQLMLPEELQSLLASADSILQSAGLNVSFANGASMKLSELIAAVDAMDEIFTGSEYEEYFRVLLNVLKSLPTDMVDIEIIIGGGLPTDIGVYVVGSISADPNYETAYGAGVIVITPDGIKADLAWNETDDNGIITNSLLANNLFDAGAHAVSVGAGGTIDEANAQIVEVFVGLNIDELDNELKGLVIELDQTKLGIGAYVEVALISNFGNQMYYAMPIVRPIVVVAETLNVDFVDASGAVNNERHFEFFNVAQKGMENLLVTYKKDAVDGSYKAGDKVTEYSVKYLYVGIQTNGQPYASTQAPVHAGVYTITAVVIVREDGVITHAGQGVGALVIEPSKSTIDVENEAIRWDGEKHNFNQFVHADSVNVPGLTPDTTVITAGIHADLNANVGLNAIQGSVNVDLPTWMDELMKKLGILEAGYTDEGITLAEFQSYVEKIESAIAELGVGTESFNKLVDVIAQLPDKATLTFHDNKGYDEVGAYLVVGIVTDSDHWPSADAGIVVIYPDAEKVELEYQKTWDDNNVFTWNVLQHYDLNAQANYAKDPAINNWLTDRAVNLFVGFADHGELILTADKADLDNGIYAEVSFLLVVDNVMYYAEPIAREVIIVPNPATIDFLDDANNVNNERHFQFFNKPWAMDRVLVTLADGTELILTADDDRIDIYYVGIQLNGQPYYSTEAPVHAGVYEVTAQYTERKDGKVYNLGIGVGVLAIEPSKSDIAVDNGAYPFGQTHYVNDLINAVSVNVPAPYRPDSTVISVGLSTNLDAISGLSSINGTVNVDLPTWMDNVLAKLNVLEAGYANGISVETFLAYVEKIEAGLLELGIETDTFAEITNVIKQLPINTNLTFQDNIGYTEVGAYLIIAVVTDSDHYPSVGAGVMVIYPDATKAELKFEEDWNDNNIFTWSALQNMNLEAEAFVSGTYSEAASKHVTNLFVGFTSDGTVMLEAVSFGEHVKDLPEFKNGVYSQVAVLLDLGNQMYYAEPISRAFVIVPTPATIEFVDGNGNVNADRHFVFNNQPHAMDVRITVNGVVVTDQTGLTVHYTGVMTNGQAYDSNEAPVNAGAYVVTATYTARDEHDRLVTLGMTVGAMVIEPAKAEINVENEAHEFGSAFETESMITVNSDVNVNIDKTIITVGLKTDGTFSENGLQAIDGDINVDLPEWLDDVLSNYSIFANGLSVAEFKNAVASVKAELAELGISTEILDRLVNVVEQFPATATLTFHDQADMAPAAVGAYLVIGVVTDSNFYPAMDAGLLVIYPDVNKTELSWIYEDTNNIYTKDTLEIIDLGAKADADIADLIVNLFIGVDAENWKITLENNQTELNIGIYEEFSFVKPNVNSVIYYAEPISRPVIVVANVYNVSIHDQVVTEMFNNTGKDMGEITITTMTGEVVDVTNGTLTVTYVGIDTMLRPYYSTEKPVHAGTYTVIATYVGNDGDGDLSFGAGIGQLIITPADVEIDAPSHAGLASQDYELNIQTKHDAVNDEPKILTIIAGVDLSAYITEGKLGIDGTVNVDFPEAIDAVLSELFPELYVNGIGTDAFFAKYDEMVAAIEARGYSADLLKQLREKLAQLNAANLTFRDDVKPTDTGLYAVIAMVCDPDYKFDMDTALIAISPDATVAELDFVMDMPQLLNAEILPFDMVDEFDFHAYVSALKSTNSGLNPEDIVLKDVIFGLTSDLQLFLGSSEEKPNEMGIYDQIAYAPAAENNLLAVLPIHRDFLITDSSANVVFVDPNGNVNWLREFTYGETVDMGASIMLADGTILTATPNVHYMGVENGIVFYNSTEVPTDAGLYTVIGYFVDAEQNIYTIGLGELLIKPKQITITVADETITAGETPVLNYTVEGLENGDDLNVNVTVDGDYSVVGTYDINATYTADPNYIVTVVNGKLTVEAKRITGEIIRNSIVPSLRLRGEVHINIHFQVRGFEGLADLEGKMGLLVWTNNNLSAAECDVTNAEFNLQGGEYDAEMGKYTVRSQGISAKNMGDKFYFKIYVQLDDGTYVYSDRFSYSAQKYCVDNLNNSNDEELKAVCVALMNYGADAQIYFAETSDYTYETLMNDLPVIDQHQHLVDEYNDGMITDLKAMDPSKHGEFVNTKGFFKRADPYVSLTGALQLNYKITVKNTEYTEAGILVWTEDVYNSAAVLTHENATKITYEGTGAGVYDVRFTGISAKDMGKTVYACAYMIVDGEYKYSGMFTYSIEEYAKSVQNSNVEDILHNVVESMVVYGDYASEYFLNH